MARSALKLNQVIALNKTAKADSEKSITAAYHQAQATPRLSGITKVYTPKDEDGDKLPPEGTVLQLHADTIIRDVAKAMTRLLDVELTKDGGNQVAVADIVLDDDTVVAEKVPVTFLLTLEKKLVDLATIISKLPVLDPSENWAWDANREAYIVVSETVRTKKVPRNHVKAEATDKHPAQVEIYFEDVVVGTWTTTKLSGALPQSAVNVLKTKVLKLQEAVKIARENANSTVAPDREIGASIFGYLLG